MVERLEYTLDTVENYFVRKNGEVPLYTQSQTWRERISQLSYLELKNEFGYHRFFARIGESLAATGMGLSLFAVDLAVILNDINLPTILLGVPGAILIAKGTMLFEDHLGATRYVGNKIRFLQNTSLSE